jgi:hypothetical protein
MTIRFYFEFAIQFVHSLAHSRQTDARFRAGLTKPKQTLRGYAASVVSYL